MESIQALRPDGTPCESYEDPEGTVLKITLSRSAPYYPSVMALWVTFPVKEEILTKAGEDWWIDPANPRRQRPLRPHRAGPPNRCLFQPNAATTVRSAR
jgi:hypothetical protein